MVELGVALGMIAPYYNLALVIVLLLLFRALFRTEQKTKVFLFPWKLLFFAVMIFIIEEALTILRSTGIIDIPVHINAFFELVIISAFIYSLLLQKEYVRKRFG
jgi:heme A synthase